MVRMCFFSSPLYRGVATKWPGGCIENRILSEYDAVMSLRQPPVIASGDASPLQRGHEGCFHSYSTTVNLLPIPSQL